MMTEQGDSTSVSSADIYKIMQSLPHRYPFLLVDRLIEVDGDRRSVGVKNVTFNEPHFQGHFPDNPIMPGVLIIEGMAQTAGATVGWHLGLKAGTSVLFMCVDAARFRKPVVPGDILHYEVVKIRNRGAVYKYACVATVDGEKVAEATITAMIAHDESVSAGS